MAASHAQLLDLLRALTLRHDELGQEIVLNEILRTLVEAHEYEQAERLLATCTLSQPYRSTNQAARYSYYVALTCAIRLDYVKALNYVSQALRKSPERALGFRIAATKLCLVVQLLKGEVPPRAEFLDHVLKESLHPYMQLTSCVRFGNLGRFMSLVLQHQSQFEHDRTYSLILRVRQNVIKTGLRRICRAYSKISLADVCVKLVLENPEDTEYIVSKAIRDGVIDATIEGSHLVTSDTVDVYSTPEPLQAFHHRIEFLNKTHNEAKRAMRYVAIDPEVEEELRKAQKQRDEALTRARDDEGDEVDWTDGI